MSKLLVHIRMASGLSLVLVALSGVGVAGNGHAPEIDPGSMASALTLLSSGFLLLTAKRRTK